MPMSLDGSIDTNLDIWLDGLIYLMDPWMEEHLIVEKTYWNVQ